MNTILLFGFPGLVALTPIFALVALTRLRVIRESARWLALATVSSGLLGYYSSWLSVFVCAGALARSMPGDGPKCVTGAALFLPIGLFVTLLTLLTGLVMTIRCFLRKRIR